MGNRFIKLIILLLLIAVPLTAGLVARYQAVPYWEKNKQFFYVEGRPIFTAYDSYLFARYAEDYKRGVYNPGGIDYFRYVPDYGSYYKVVPLPSWLTAELSSLFHTHVENVAFWLIPLLAVLVAIPIAFWFFSENLIFAGLAGALVSVLSFIYVIRSGLNRLDTDTLLLFSMFAIPFGVYLYSKAKGLKSRLLSLLLIAFFVDIFYWWYIHAGLIFALFLFGVLYLFIEYYDRYSGNFPSRVLNFLKDKDFWLFVLVFNPVILLEGVGYLIKKVSHYVLFFGHSIEGFPNVQISISELKHIGLNSIAAWTIGNKVLFFLAFIGVILFALSRYRIFTLLLPSFLIGLIAFKGGSRFAMFLAPVLGIGLGYILDILITPLREKLGKTLSFAVDLLLMAAVTFILILANYDSFKFKPQPIMYSSLAQSFIDLGRTTPKDAWIWTWWDYGYAIQYYARRATFHDGGSQYSPKTYFVALSFTNPSQALGYNVTRSVSICGAKCIQKMLQEGKTPEEIKNLFISGALLKGKHLTHPVYWLFTPDLIGKFYWISYFGSWDFKLKKGVHSGIMSMNCKTGSLQSLVCYSSVGPVVLNLVNMYMIYPNNTQMPIKILAVRTPDKLTVKENKYANYGIAVEEVYTAYPNYYAWYATDLMGYQSNFNNLYILRVYDKKYFEKTEEIFPRFVVYKVR